eukprot:UN21583
MKEWRQKKTAAFVLFQFTSCIKEYFMVLSPCILENKTILMKQQKQETVVLSKPQWSVKLVVNGDSDVGKTSMLETYKSGSFPTGYLPRCFEGHRTCQTHSNSLSKNRIRMIIMVTSRKCLL